MLKIIKIITKSAQGNKTVKINISCIGVIPKSSIMLPIFIKTKNKAGKIAVTAIKNNEIITNLFE